MVVLGFAGCAMISYDRALWTLRIWLVSWPGTPPLGCTARASICPLTQYDGRGWCASGTRGQRGPLQVMIAPTGEWFDPVVTR